MKQCWGSDFIKGGQRWGRKWQLFYIHLKTRRVAEGLEQQEDKTTKMRCYAEERKIAGFELALQCNHSEGQCRWSRWMRVEGCRLRGQSGRIGVVGKRQTRVMIAGLR